MILQWAETQIDSAHSAEHLPGDLQRDENGKLAVRLVFQHWLRAER